MNTLDRTILSILQILPKPLMRPFAMRYIAGESLDDAVRVVRTINSKGMMATVDVLGENVSDREASLTAVKACEDVLHAIYENHLDANVSIKLTQFGLKIDEEFCYSNVINFLEIAKGYHNFVRIDMEDSSTTSATIALYRRLRSDGFENSGIVIQANMRRSEEDIEGLVSIRPNIRLCKGAYVEPESIAFTDREEIRSNYLKLLKLLLHSKCYVGIATHDEVLIRKAYQSIREVNLERSEYEFQMLYGVRASLRDRISNDGHRVRIYVPFGQSWHPYSIRRFKENPQIARYVLRALFLRE